MLKKLTFRPVFVSEGDDDNDENDVDIIFENGKVKMSLQLCWIEKIRNFTFHEVKIVFYLKNIILKVIINCLL